MRPIAVVVVLLSSGCALYVNGPRQAVLINSDPPGAEVTYGEAVYLTPALINVKRTGLDLDVYLDGFAPAKATFTKEADGWLLFFDIIPGCNPIALIVDLAYGAQNWLVPDTQVVKLQPVSPEEAAKIKEERAEVVRKREEEAARRKRAEAEARRRAEQQRNRPWY